MQHSDRMTGDNNTVRFGDLSCRDKLLHSSVVLEVMVALSPNMAGVHDGLLRTWLRNTFRK